MFSDLTCEYGDGIYSEPEISDLMNEVAAKIPAQWRAIGLQLKLTVDDLDGIDMMRHGCPLDFFSYMLTMWKKKNPSPFKWATIIEVLKSPAVGERSLAEELRKKLTGCSN